MFVPVCVCVSLAVPIKVNVGFASVLCAFMSVFVAVLASAWLGVIKLSRMQHCDLLFSLRVCDKLGVSYGGTPEHFSVTLGCQGTLLWGRWRATGQETGEEGNNITNQLY